MITVFFLAKHLKMYLSWWIIWEVKVSKIQRFFIEVVLIKICSSSCHPNAAYTRYCAHNNRVDGLPIERVLSRSELEKEKSACSYSNQTWQQRKIFYVVKRRKLENRLNFKHEEGMPEKIREKYLAEFMRKSQRSKYYEIKTEFSELCSFHSLQMSCKFFIFPYVLLEKIQINHI